MVIAASTMLHLPVAWNLIRRAGFLSPNTPGVPGMTDETLAIACLPILIGWVLAVWSLRTRHGRIALAAALTILAVVVAWQIYHFEVVVPGIRAAGR